MPHRFPPSLRPRCDPRQRFLLSELTVEIGCDLGESQAAPICCKRYDAWFCGLLQHSCNPNVFLDTTYLELWTVQPIAAGTALTLDYSMTKDTLFRQLACHCGELNCRGWITGSKEPLNAEGQAFMAWWCEHKRS
ncbi:MAG: hypothetical protein K0S85_3598 [Pseudomonas orientalis]|nr:hypothetical protein [Pseudomonas orientalis]